MDSDPAHIPRDVVVLWHVRERDGDEDVKLVGIYSDHEAAHAAIARKLTYPGFSDNPDGFTLDVYRVDEDAWSEGFVTE